MNNKSEQMFDTCTLEIHVILVFTWNFNRPFCLFSFDKDQKSIDTAGKITLKLGNLQSLKVICPKQAEILLHKVAKFFRHW